RPPARDLAQDLRAALASTGLRLQDQGAGALAAEDAVAPRVEGAARPLGLVVAAAQGEHRGEARDTDRGDGRLCPAAHHHVDIAPAQPLHGLADRVRARRAGARVTIARAMQAV